MALQIRRGTDLQRQSVVLAAGEPFFVTDYASIGISPLWIGDGTTLGGVVAEGVNNLDELLDVTLLNPQNNDFLRYNSSNGRWENVASLNTGNLTLTGDIAINGGDATTTATTFNLINTTATTLNMGGAATALNLGGTTGTATINNAALKLTGNTIKASDGATALTLTAVSGDVTVNGDLTVTGNDIKSSTGTAITLAGADVAIAGDLTVTGNDIKSSTGTAITLGGTNATVNGNLILGSNTIKASDGTTALTTSTITGETTVATNLVLGGNVIKASTGATAITTSGSNVIIAGNLTVNGTTTTVNSTNLNITDNMILLNKDESGAGVTAGVAGIEIERGSLPNVQLQFNDSVDRWEITTDGSTYTRLPNQSLDSSASPTFDDIYINGGDILTSSSTGNVFNTVATTVNIGNDATTEVNLGNISSGKVQIKPATIVGANTTQNVFNTVATTVNAFGAASTLYLGSNTGTTTIRNGLQVNGNTIKSMEGNTAITLSGSDVSIGDQLTIPRSRITTSLTLTAETGNILSSAGGVGYSYITPKNTTILGVPSGIWEIGNGLDVNGSMRTINGNSIVSSGLLGTWGKTITLNDDNSTDTADALITVKRGATGSAVSLKWNESTDKWQFTNNGTDYYNLVSSDPATGDITVSGTLTATTVLAGTIVSTGGNFGSNGKTLTLNYDAGTDTDDGFLKINRGATGADVSLKWNETTDRWQFTNDGSTFNNMLTTSDLSYDLNSLTDVVINTPATNQLLKYNGTNWVNSTVSYALDNLTDVVITSSTTGQLLTYDGTNWVNNNTITATSAAQTVNLTRSGAFTADTASTIRSTARLTKKFTDVSGVVSDQGGPSLTFSVEGSDSTISTYAGLSSNRSAVGAHSVSVLTSTDNFATTQEAVNFTYAETSFPGAVSIIGAVSASAIIIDDKVIKNTSTQTYTTTSQQVFGNVPIDTYRSVKYTWQISRGSEFQMLETLVIHDGFSAYITVFGDTRTGANLANFDVDISGSNMRILVTPTSATSTKIVADYTLFYI